jgi:hypothetical protein
MVDPSTPSAGVFTIGNVGSGVSAERPIRV